MTEKYLNFKENSIGLERVNERLAMRYVQKFEHKLLDKRNSLSWASLFGIVPDHNG